jgi:hypothetical protein
MLEVLIVIGFGLLPCILSLLGFTRMQRQAEERLQASIYAAQRRQMRQLLQNSTSQNSRYALPKPILGDPDCRFSANSSYIRCAVNPAGNCEDCRYFERI